MGPVYISVSSLKQIFIDNWINTVREKQYLIIKNDGNQNINQRGADLDENTLSNIGWLIVML